MHLADSGMVTLSICSRPNSVLSISKFASLSQHQKTGSFHSHPCYQRKQDSKLMKSNSKLFLHSHRLSSLLIFNASALNSHSITIELELCLIHACMNAPIWAVYIAGYRARVFTYCRHIFVGFRDD